MIFIGVGSSVGQAESHFKKAEQYLARANVGLVKKSALLKNPPQGGVAQNEFTNAVWQIEFWETPWQKVNWVLLPKKRRLKLKAYQLLKILQSCENSCNRIREKKWDDRTLDLDLLMFHQLKLNEAHLKIPHPLIPERNFVLLPWQELVDKNFEIPKFGKISSLINRLTRN